MNGGPDEDAGASLRIADEFVEGLAGIYSQRLMERIRQVLDTLRHNPEIGSRNVRRSLVERYGEGLRKIPVSTFVIVYRFDGEVVDVLSLVYGPRVK